MTWPMRIALLGTRGVPARYGGFETAVEEIGRRLAERGHEVLVYCRRPGANDSDSAAAGSEYLGMRRVVIPCLHSKALETLSHTGLSSLHLLANRADAAVVFNSANSIYLPLLRARGIPMATHVDGLEWQRAKWGGAARNYYRRAEQLAVRWSDALIADAPGIADYYRREFGVATEQISYGAEVFSDCQSQRLGELGLQPRGYHLVVARFEPENHIDMIVRGFRASSARLPLVVVGSAPHATQYTERITTHAAGDARVRLLGAIWDQELLNQLYANAYSYLHGHSVGGTNPSLLRAMGAGAPVLANDVVFNRDVLREHAAFFCNEQELAALLPTAEQEQDEMARRGRAGQQVVAERFQWGQVAARYEELLERLHRGYTIHGTATGRRSAASSAPLRPGSVPADALAVSPPPPPTR
ncbi:MAG: DUF1972 domain-containing protein [Candidatus Nanopelagicales bacterium]